MCCSATCFRDCCFSSKTWTRNNKITFHSLHTSSLETKDDGYVFWRGFIRRYTLTRTVWLTLNALQASSTVKKILISRHIAPADSSKLSQHLSTVVTFNYSFNACHHQSLFQGHGGSRHRSSDWMDGRGQESRSETVSTCDRDHDNAATRQLFLIVCTPAVTEQISDSVRVCVCMCGYVCVWFLFKRYSNQNSQFKSLNFLISPNLRLNTCVKRCQTKNNPSLDVTWRRCRHLSFQESTESLSQGHRRHSGVNFCLTTCELQSVMLKYKRPAHLAGTVSDVLSKYWVDI